MATVYRNLWQVLGICAAIALASTVQGQEVPANVSAVEEAAQAFFDAAHSFDFEAMRAGATSDFEMLYNGRRMTLDDFIGMFRGMEESRDGRALPTYKAVGLNTEVVGEREQEYYRNLSAPAELVALN